MRRVLKRNLATILFAFTILPSAKPTDVIDPKPPDNKLKGVVFQTQKPIHVTKDELLARAEDIIWLARTVYAEARGEPYEGKVAVAAVALNRLKTGYWGKDVKSVVTKKAQFAVSKKYDDECLRAAIEAMYGHDPTGGALYFLNPKTATDLSWSEVREAIGYIGQHKFYK